MSFIWQGCEDKQKTLPDALVEAGFTNVRVAFVGDDLNDIPLLQSGLGIAVLTPLPRLALMLTTSRARSAASELFVRLWN